jgi:hypothetical protein
LTLSFFSYTMERVDFSLMSLPVLVSGFAIYKFSHSKKGKGFWGV